MYFWVIPISTFFRNRWYNSAAIQFYHNYEMLKLSLIWTYLNSGEPFKKIGHTYLYTTEFQRYSQTHYLGCYLTAVSFTLLRQILWYLAWYLATTMPWSLDTVCYREKCLYIKMFWIFCTSGWFQAFCERKID